MPHGDHPSTYTTPFPSDSCARASSEDCPPRDELLMRVGCLQSENGKMRADAEEHRKRHEKRLLEREAEVDALRREIERLRILLEKARALVPPDRNARPLRPGDISWRGEAEDIRPSPDLVRRVERLERFADKVEKYSHLLGDA